MIVKIGSPLEIVDYEPGSLVIEDRINFRATGSLSVLHEVGDWFAEAQPIEIYEDDGSTKLFTGFVDGVDAEEWLRGDQLRSSLTIKDNHYLAEKRRITKIYEAQTAGTIVTDFITSILTNEGITAGTIEAGPTITRAVFNYVPVPQALDQLAERVGFAWYIDKDRALHFHSRTTNAASQTLTWATVRDGSLKIRRRSGHYRNRQYIRGATDITSSLTEDFKADGTAKSWTVGYPIIEEPTIRVGPSTALQTKTVGRKGVDTLREYYWTPGDATITQDAAGTPPAAPDLVRVIYRGQFPVITQDERTAEQTSRASTEGVGTGIVEHVEDDPSQTTRAAALELASALLDRYTEAAVEISFETQDIDDLRPGQVLTVQLAEHNLASAQFLVTEVTTRETVDSKFGEPVITWSVLGIDGPEGDTWIRWFARQAALLDRMNLLVEGGDQSVIRRFQYSKTWSSSTELPRPFEGARPNILPSSTTAFPAIAQQHKVVYLAWGDSVSAGPGGHLGNELGRKRITQLTVQASQHLSTAILNLDEANLRIREFAWYAGQGASATAASGLLLERVSVDITKVAGEVLQIERTDTKGY